ncbi:hypothetical protein C8A00DRAFT_14303 [Chaetomidium leptoderma]|uniref:LPXTG-domain-containing protein n=1 Tax=Chaetomidium leptoderma TaxID=669021 RepID=A0AAN6VMZ2_9PEZI|nr:hypothetical protein C8A00DRAFT_14303 [Chaetomidium leptoderma]
MARPALFTLLTLFSTLQFSSALQVTPNSPCSSECRDSLDLDVSDPNSSNTINSDITCLDTAYSSAAGSKFKSCMTCLQTSTFSQGSESDTMWFLYNLRYTAAYCVFGYPNATGHASTPCTTDTACGPLQASLEHGIPDPRKTTAYSYCSAGGGEASDPTNFEHCTPCISAEGRTKYLVNYFVALEAGCRQQPGPGVLLGLNDTIFSETKLDIVDPATLLKADEARGPGLAIPVIVGIAAGAVVLLLIVAGFTFVCLRKRRNKRVRASAEADFYNHINNRHRSSMSFQCQTHMVSPRFWPSAGGDEGVSTPVVDSPDTQAHRSSIWKPHDLGSPYHADDATITTTTTHIPKKAAMTAAPLHITTTISPARPPQAYTSPASAERVYPHSPSDFRSPLSAESVRSTSALLPSIKPYVPAEHGVHVQGGGGSSSSPVSAAFVSSPISATTTTTTTTGTGMTPLLKSNNGWPFVEPAQQQQQQLRPQSLQKVQKPVIKLDGRVPPPPPLKTTSRSSSGGGMLMGRKSPRMTGSPVESWEIQTAFAAPPKR